MRYSLVVFMILSFGSVRLARADDLPELSNYFDRKLGEIETSCTDTAASGDASGSDAMELQDIDIAPQVTFGLPGVLSLSIAPEIDVVLVPDGGSP